MRSSTRPTDTTSTSAPRSRELPPQQRIAVGLYYGGGYPVSEIAAAMDLADGTVKYHLHAARERLRAVLAEEHDGRA